MFRNAGENRGRAKAQGAVVNAVLRLLERLKSDGHLTEVAVVLADVTLASCCPFELLEHIHQLMSQWMLPKISPYGFRYSMS